MKLESSLRLLLASLFATAAFAVPAQTATTSAGASTDAPSATVSNKDEDAGARNNMAPGIDRYCPRDTGSRIVSRNDSKKRCTASGRVYTSEDIRSTGAINIADALRMLDPAIR